MKKLNIIFSVFVAVVLLSCKPQQNINKEELANLIDNWHKAAAQANLDSYFGMMSDSAVYIGTDPGERWAKQEFYSFCEPYFSKGKAWDFRPYNREIYFSEDGNTIWFNELLETWMGICCGSGVIIKENGSYKISHYHLSVTVKNEKIKDFLKIK